MFKDLPEGQTGCCVQCNELGKQLAEVKREIEYKLETIKALNEQLDGYSPVNEYIKQLAEVRKERDALSEAVDRLSGKFGWVSYERIMKDNDSLRSLLNEMAEAMQKVMYELGVPQIGYAQPVANAYEIAEKALASYREKVKK